MNSNTLRTLGFNKEMNRVEQKLCPFCGKPATLADMPNEISKKEFLISGMCFSCQERVFSSDS